PLLPPLERGGQRGRRAGAATDPDPEADPRLGEPRAVAALPRAAGPPPHRLRTAGVAPRALPGRGRHAAGDHVLEHRPREGHRRPDRARLAPAPPAPVVPPLRR